MRWDLMARQLGLIGMATGALVGAGCDKLTATTQAVSILTSSPNITESPDFSSAFTEIIPPQPELEGVTAVFLGAGDRSSPTSTEPPTPLEGANVQLSFGDVKVEVCPAPDAAGTYSATSIVGDECGSADLEYIAEELYVTDMDTSEDLYTASVKAPTPVAYADVTFSPSFSSDSVGVANIKTHSSNTALTVDWSADANAGENNVFLTLMRLDYLGSDLYDPLQFSASSNWAFGGVVYDDAPRAPGDMIDMVLNAPGTSAEIPGSAFDQSGMYMLVVTSAALDTNTSDNLSLGSGALAGKGTAFLFFVSN